MLKTLPPSTTTQQPHSTLQTDITGAPTRRYINMTSSCFMLVSGEEVVTAGMSRTTSQHHCKVVPLHVQDMVRCHCFSPPWHTVAGTGAGGGGKARVVVGSRIADQYSTITTTVVSPDSCRLAGAGEHCHWSEDAGLTITPSPPQQLPAQGK